MKRLFICEKENQAAPLAAVIGNEIKKDGYYEVGNDIIVWLQGHILGLKMPVDYDAALKTYSYDTLPIIPEHWEKMVKTPKYYHKIYSTVCNLLKKVDEVVNVGDADREGQLLIDEVLEFAGNTLPVKRLYLNALDNISIERELNNIIDNAGLRNRYLAALARERTDWLFGINGSRKFSLDAGQAIRFGRVKIPMLALVARRNDEIDNFKSIKHYGVKAFFRTENSLPFEAIWKPADDLLDADGRLIDVLHAREVEQKIKGKPGIIKSIETKKETAAPPLPYSLSTLQREAEPAFGFSPSKTLELAQSLYEKKLTTYPRSDCNFLPESQIPDAQTILANLKLTGNNDLKTFAEGADSSIQSKSFNTKKISAHHAIIPTMEKIDLQTLSADEQNLYYLIAKRYILQFYPGHEFNKTTAQIECEGEIFTAKGKVILNNGWKAIEKDKEESNDDKQLPALQENDNVILTVANVIEKNTTPPARFTQSSLIGALTNAHKYVQNPVLREKLKNIKGIGTEATRSTIIKQLIDSGMFIEKVNKKTTELYVSDPVKELIACLPDEVTYPDTTAIMELSLDKIEAGELSLEDYMKEQEEYVRQIINLPSKFTQVPRKGKYPTCPVCEKGTLFPHDGKFGKFWSCSKFKNGCKAVFQDAGGQPVIEKCPVCGKGYLQKRAGKNGAFWSCSEYKNEKNSCKAMFSDVKGKPVIKKCPSCKKGYLILHDGKLGKFYGCNNYPDCDATFEQGKTGLPVMKKKGK